MNYDKNDVKQRGVRHSLPVGAFPAPVGKKKQPCYRKTTITKFIVFVAGLKNKYEVRIDRKNLKVRRSGFKTQKEAEAFRDAALNAVKPLPHKICNKSR